MAIEQFYTPKNLYTHQNKFLATALVTRPSPSMGYGKQVFACIPMGIDNNGHKPWQRHNLVKFVQRCHEFGQFLKSTPLDFHVFIAVAITICGCHGIGPIPIA